MRFIVAPDSFKGSMTSKEAGSIIREAILQEMPDAAVRVFPVADGGEGTVDALLYSGGGEKVEQTATGPLGREVQAYYGIMGDRQTAVIEMAAIAGLALAPENERNPLNTTTAGVGQCILHALERGLRKFIIGLGGSATNDGGLGMLQALGARFTDASGQPVPPVASSLAQVRSVDLAGLHPLLKQAELRIACDVDNPLCGPHGASAMFGPQKGATPAQVEELDRGLANYAQAVEERLKQPGLCDTPGAGAAGGLGFGLLALGARMESGARLIAEAAQIEALLAEADWLFVGEGRTDEQTLHGKGPFYLASLAKRHGVKTVLLSGSLTDRPDDLYSVFDSMHSIANGPMTLEQAIAAAPNLLYHAARNIVRLWK
ncbi:glycerate kinase [Paenibacillus sp. J2TS4]|uniref:glycerate kinase n=1 Tax=Paenibacillus sp. J2TS4 TaxID=2807194 RepID=UPI001B24C9C0|nr:glycerate kinase [Paenibacillus sp. J2TS4]GIP34992.1 glycerate kinase [Paenibacillus sp. J2TS4]